MADDAADINRSVFNEEALNYDNKHRKLNERLTRELQSRLDWIGVDWAVDEDDADEEQDECNAVDGSGDARLRRPPRREVRLLDYACGTGMMSRALAAYTTQCIGLDISEKMVAAYNLRAENQGLSHEEMHAALGDLASPSVSESLSAPEFFNFDIAVVGGGFHHFGNPDLAAKRLVERLKPGGVLLIWDFMPHGPLPGHHHHGHHDESQGSAGGHHAHQRQDHHDHDHHGKAEGATPSALPENSSDHHAHAHAHSNVHHSVMHHGFSEERMREIFTAAGAVGDFELEEIGGGFTFGQKQQKPEQSLDAIAEDEEEESGGDKDVGKGKGIGKGEANEGGRRHGQDETKESGSGGYRRDVFFARGTKI